MAISRKEYLRMLAEGTIGKIEESRKEVEKLSRDIQKALENRIFNMPITMRAEHLLRNKLRILAFSSLGVSLILLAYMLKDPEYFIAAILTGILAAAYDFAVEYKGIMFREWNYPQNNLSFRSVPYELPVLFFSTGVAAAYVVYAFTSPLVNIAFRPVAYISPVQAVLLLAGALYMYRYFTHAVDSITFGAMPIALAMYLAYPEPWILVVSVIPVYIDYYLEKYMVSFAEITYDKYSFEKAFNVAVSYFPSAIILLVFAAIMSSLMAGVI